VKSLTLKNLRQSKQIIYELERPMNIPLTVVILTKDEESAISRCVDSVSGADQVLVVDSNSTDKTVQIAQEKGVEVINFTWNGVYPKKKQWAFENKIIRNDWVLFLDADEAASSTLMSELRHLLEKPQEIKSGAFFVDLDYWFMGKMLRFGHKVRKRALLNRSCCSFPIIDDLHVSNMWEVEGHYQPICNKQVGLLHGRISHLDPDPLFDYFSRHNRYSDWEAELRINARMRESVRKVRTRQGAIFDKFPGKPLLFFLYSYFWKSGWRDGRVGFSYALALSFYYWQISIKVFERKYNA
jgi:glycosyltransferase involved in cell wall biosynthesis